jgi:hypothetical protein
LLNLLRRPLKLPFEYIDAIKNNKKGIQKEEGKKT